MSPDAATTQLLDYGAVGSMLVLAVCAIMWLAQVFRRTTESHLQSVVEITSKHSQQIEEKEQKNQDNINAIIAEFKREREVMNEQSAKERETFVKAYQENTVALHDLWLAVDKRHTADRRVKQQ